MDRRAPAISSPLSSKPPAHWPIWWSPGIELVVTHGNGPQVGNLLVKNELAAGVVPPVPLDWCGAQTQATIGVLVMNALDAALAARSCAVRTTAVISRTLVDGNDPGFAEPTKPIGRYLPEAEAAVMIGHGQIWQDRGSPRLAADGRLAGTAGLPGCAGSRHPDGRRLRRRVLRRRRHSGRSVPAHSSIAASRPSSTRI